MPVSLAAHHTRVISGHDLARRMAAPQFDGIPRLLEDDGRTFRLVQIADKESCLRRQWLSDVITWQQQFNYSQDSVGYLCQEKHSFSVLFVSGDDQRRVYSILREARGLLPSKIIVGVVSNSSPDLDANLLRRGADDVLHCRMAPQEAVGRLYALIRRKKWARDRQMHDEHGSAMDSARLMALSTQRLTPMEERILSLLAKSEGRVMAYWYISSCVSRSWDAGSNLRSLHVTVHRLRRKLASGVQIEAVWGRGYVLTQQVLPAARTGSAHAS